MFGGMVTVAPASHPHSSGHRLLSPVARSPPRFGGGGFLLSCCETVAMTIEQLREQPQDPSNSVMRVMGVIREHRVIRGFVVAVGFLTADGIDLAGARQSR